MRVPNAVHQARPWVFNRIAPDFRLLDVWALPVEGSLTDADAALEMLTTLDPTELDSRVARALFAVRLKLGGLLGWDDARPRPIPGCRETSLRDRLPAELRETATGGPFAGFEPVYRTADEYAAELANETVHGVLHLTWVEQEAGRYRAHLAVYVKPRGALGSAYLRLIDPFRHLIVYPALMRYVRRKWDQTRS